jgi:hypothetical protein
MSTKVEKLCWRFTWQCFLVHGKSIARADSQSGHPLIANQPCAIEAGGIIPHDQGSNALRPPESIATFKN